MSATTTDQVSIDVEQMGDFLNTTKQKESLSGGEIAVDGRRSGGHRRHDSNGSHRHSYHSGESDVDEKHDHHHHSHGKRHRRRSRSRSHSPSHRSRRAAETGTPPTEKDVATNSHDVEPLLVTDVNQKKPTEFDEDSDDSVTQHEQNPGVDDGFFVGAGVHPDNGTDKFHPPTNNHIPNDNQPFPFAPGFNPNVILDQNGNPQVIPDINVYQQKKNLAQGMMDLALLSANANQLRYVVETYARHPYYWFSLISISISLILQVAVGVGLILNSRYNVKNKEQICRADKINNFTIIGIFLITAVNVFITAFGVAPPESRPN